MPQTDLPPIADRGALSLTLDAHELALLRRALHVLATPLEWEDVDAWRRQGGRLVRELLGGDRAVFQLPAAGTAPMLSDEYGEEILSTYRDEFRDSDEGWRRVRAAELTIFCRRMLFARDRAKLLASDCYNEFLGPHGIEDSVGMLTDPASPEGAGLWVHYERDGRSGAGVRGMQILSLLLPAFRVGATVWQRFHDRREHLGALLDTVGGAVAVFDLEGRMLHRSAALSRLRSAVSETCDLDGRIRSAARAAAEITAAGGEGDARDLDQRIDTGGGRFEIQAVRIDRPLGLGRECVMVSVRPYAPVPDDAALRRRLGLTRREAEVARLLTARRTNREIAEELSISPHTSRHHTERVLAKLGVHSRRDVKGAVERALRAPSRPRS